MGVVFMSFLGIVTYHIYMQIESKVQYIQLDISYSVKMKSATESVRMNTTEAT